ncbi:integrase core domain-containing protein [Actinoplanes sp. NPDC049118]|uniref:integrase core domain-containing protein n=1 Tax=Actinoplanes sp. NPDC049118 TaxID=3155769 RepID=UPI0033C50650
MHLWQLDLVGGIFLADGRECKMLTGIDDHSRFVVIATVLAVPSGRAVADAFLAAMRVYGVPAEVLTDNGKQFTGRFTKGRPAEVLFERVCRENGITGKLTRPYSPTTTGKIERWHRTLRRELLDVTGPFADLPTAQAAISGWVHAYNYERPHQALDMATPASLFRPNIGAEPNPAVIVSQPPRSSAALELDVSPPATSTPPILLPASAPAVEFDTVIAAGGMLSVLPRVQRIRMGPARGGQPAHVWADENSVHILIDGELVKTVPSNLNADDLHELRMRGAQPAGSPPASTPALTATTTLPGKAVVEVDRIVDNDGITNLAGTRLRLGADLHRRKVTLRLDGHLMHVIHDGRLVKTLPAPIPADQRTSLRGARLTTTALPAPASGPISVQRKVPTDGKII